MDPLAVSTSIATLLKNVHDVVGIADIVGHESDPELGDLGVLMAFYNDINYLVLSLPRPPTFSIHKALLRCQTTQKDMMTLLEEIGYGRLKRSPKRIDRIRYSVNLYLKQDKLARTQKAYREAVILLRDIAME